MKNKIKYGVGSIFALLFILVGCSTEDYSMGDLDAPSNVVINTEIAGQDEVHPYGDGSGVVNISVTADNALAYKIDFGNTSSINLTPFNGEVSKQYTTSGINDYRLTVVVYGAGGAATTVTKDITVESVFSPDPEIVSIIVGEGSKTWVVDKSVAGHFGVGPYNNASVVPEWWSAGVNEKVGSADCFYSTTFTFNQTGEDFSIVVDSPEGAFTKTGDLTTLPGVPDSGEEGCYDGYTGGTSPFTFVPASSGLPASTPSTQTSIELVGNDVFIGYGATQKEYEILEITPEFLYLRVQGTETGNAWYIRLIPVE